jgi:phosphoserine aminotransferase
MSKKINFYAGPSILPQEVLEGIHEQILDFNGLGLSLIETSHRSKEYDEVHFGAIKLLRELLNVPENYKILILQGGATMQFGMIPMNLLPANHPVGADFVNSGAWAKKAISDAKKIGKVNILYDGKDNNYMELPATVKATPGAAYIHITTNETIGGLQFKNNWPETGDVPLVADMSSDIMSRPLDISKFALIYAGAQKNLAPAGATIVIIRDDLLEKCPDTLPVYLNYKTHAEGDSLYNTPPVFTIWAMKLYLEHVKALGGTAYMEKMANQRADAIYDAMEKSNGFYKCPVQKEYRSNMNVVFTLPTPELDEKFVSEAKKLGMVGLKGHRSVGGCRASIYNAMPMSGVEKLVDFMSEFHKNNS